MTIYICIGNAAIDTIELFDGDTIADAAQAALRARGIEVTAEQVQPIGSTHYHIIERAVDPDGFWAAQLSYAMIDDEEWGWGATTAEAIGAASPEYDA